MRLGGGAIERCIRAFVPRARLSSSHSPRRVPPLRVIGSVIAYVADHGGAPEVDKMPPPTRYYLYPALRGSDSVEFAQYSGALRPGGIIGSFEKPS